VIFNTDTVSETLQEERKVLRMNLAFALRRVKLLTSQQRVRQYLAHLENFFIKHFHANRALKTEFYASEKFAEDLCTEVVDDVLVSVILWAPGRRPGIDEGFRFAACTPPYRGPCFEYIDIIVSSNAENGL